jgi:hypothetical protein
VREDEKSPRENKKEREKKCQIKGYFLAREAAHGGDVPGQAFLAWSGS